MRRLLFVFSVSLMFCAGLCSAKPQPAPPKAKAPLVLKTDSTTVNLRRYDAAALKAYRQQPDFQYREDNAPAPSLWDRFWDWFWSMFKTPKHSSRVTGVMYQLLRIMLIILGLAAIVFIILRVIGVDISALFKGRPAPAGLAYSEVPDNIHEINFDDELDRAVAQRNYRLAVRLLYLKALKQLNDAGQIEWRPHKTNAAYVNELREGSQRSQFGRLTRQFEYIWYGGFTIDAPAFEQVNAAFLNFKQGLAA